MQRLEKDSKSRRKYIKDIKIKAENKTISMIIEQNIAMPSKKIKSKQQNN